MKTRTAIVVTVVLAGASLGGLAGTFVLRDAPASAPPARTAEYMIGGHPIDPDPAQSPMPSGLADVGAPWTPEPADEPVVEPPKCTMVPDVRQVDWYGEFIAAGGDPRCVDIPASVGSVEP